MIKMYDVNNYDLKDTDVASLNTVQLIFYTSEIYILFVKNVIHTPPIIIVLYYAP